MVRIPSLRLSESRCASTVRVEMSNRAAISLLASPCATNVTTSRSLGVRTAGDGSPTGGWLWRRDSATCREISGERNSSPSWTARTAARRSAGAESLRRYPWAPDRIDSSTYSRLSCTLSMSTRVVGDRSRTSGIAWSPDPSDIDMSSTRTSGCSSAHAEIASATLRPSPTIEKPDSVSSTVRTPSRTTA